MSQKHITWVKIIIYEGWVYCVSEFAFGVKFQRDYMDTYVKWCLVRIVSWANSRNWVWIYSKFTPLPLYYLHVWVYFTSSVCMNAKVCVENAKVCVENGICEKSYFFSDHCWFLSRWLKINFKATIYTLPLFFKQKIKSILIFWT